MRFGIYGHPVIVRASTYVE